MTTDRGTFALLELTTPGGIPRVRWQTRWLDPVSFEGVTWAPMDFGWGAIDSRISSGDRTSITLAAVPSVEALLRQAAAEQWRATLRSFAYVPSGSDAAPPSGAVLAGSAVGIVSVSGLAFTSISIEISSALGSAGSQSGSVTATPALVGVPVELNR